MDIGTIKNHPAYGPMEVRGKISNYLRVTFLNTGHVITTQTGHFNNLQCVDDMYKWYVKQIYTTPVGPAFIISFLGPIINHEPTVRIQFGNTGFICNTTIENLVTGNVIDPSYDIMMEKIYLSHNMELDKRLIDIDRFYSSHLCGLFKILSIHRKDRCYIQFIKTGYVTEVSLSKALEGKVDDKFQTQIIPFDRTYLGMDYDRWIRYRLNDRWHNMVARCTNENAACYNVYGGIGVSVVDRWMNFDTFAQDAVHLPQFDKFYNYPFLYCLDKDYLQLAKPKAQRIYSPDTCFFLYNNDNINIEAFEKRREHPEMYSSQYYGVCTKNNGRTFRAAIKINRIELFLKTFSNEIAAASCYNWHHRKNHCYELFPLFNDINEMDPTEFIQYNVNPITLYHLI